MIAIIADLHLQADTPATLAQAVNFLDWAEGRCEQLYILGDLFEYWLGDDAPLPGLSRFDTALKSLSDSGCQITLMHGNRDFLLGEKYCKSVGAQLERADTRKIQLGTRTALLLHGDTLCTDDTDYQQARQLLRSAEWQNNFCALPIETRKQQALALRRQSQNDSASKTEDIMDVNTTAAIVLAKSEQIDLLIHGHTHRPDWHKVHDFDRVVVGDWHANGAYVALYDNQEISLKHWPFDR